MANNYCDVVLIFPPQWSPLQPYLATPSLTAYLRREGISVNQYDLNIDFFHEILSREFLEPMCQGLNAIYDELSKRSSLSPDEQSKLYRIFLIRPEFDSVLSGIDNARLFLKSDAFYDLQEKSIQFTLVNAAFNIINLFCYVELSFDHFEFPVSPNSLDEIIAYTGAKGNFLLSLFENQVERVISSQRCKIAGISLTDSSQLIPALTMARRIKKNHHGIHLTIGGNLLTRCVEGLLKRVDFFNLFADSVVLYEGEKPLLELVKTLKLGGTLEKVPNLIYLDKKVTRTRQCGIADMNSLPTPDFDGLDFDRYFSPKLILPLLSSRGCYWGKCTFCDHSFIYGKDYRQRRPDLVANDLLTLKKKYGTDCFSFSDEAISPGYAENLSNAIIKSGINARIISQARLERAFSEKICQLMYKAGFKIVFIGLESGSKKILDRMKKGIDIQHASDVMKNFHDAGIWVHLFVIMGFPGETEKDREETVNFVLNNSNNILSVGAGSFSIGKFSDVGRNPSKYDVAIQPEEGDNTLNYVCEFEYLTNQSRSANVDFQIDFMKMAREKLQLGYIWGDLRREQVFLYFERYSSQELQEINQNFEAFKNHLFGISRGSDDYPGPDTRPRLRRGVHLLPLEFNMIEIQENLREKSGNQVYPVDTWILYNFFGQECISLNPHGGFLIGLCNGTHSIEDISLECSKKFNSDTSAMKKVVLDFFNDYKINRLLEFNGCIA